MSSGTEQYARLRRLHPAMKVAYECEKVYVDRWLLEHPDLARPRVIDAGCGFRYGLIWHYAGRFDVLGVEWDPQILRKNADVTWKVVGDAMNLPAGSAAFDLVFCRDVLEHLSDPTSALREFERVLRPGGMAVVTTVNVRNPGMWAIRLTPRWMRSLVRGASFGEELADNAPTFHRANTPQLLCSRAREAGLNVEVIETWPSFLWYFRFLPPAMYAMGAINGILDRFGVRGLFGGMTLVARKPA